jgi:hypothetical protein
LDDARECDMTVPHRPTWEQTDGLVGNGAAPAIFQIDYRT